MAPEQPEVEVIAQYRGAYSLARLKWAAGRVTFQELWATRSTPPPSPPLCSTRFPEA
jgi:hypothetical protein